MRYFFLFLVLCAGLAGCAKLAHLDELLTLKDLSENRDAQDVFVEKQNNNFKKLLAAVNDRSVSSYQNKKDFLKAFGKPILVKQGSQNDQVIEKWLYRYMDKPFGSPKVYAYFDQQDQCLRLEYYPRTEETTAAQSDMVTLFPMKEHKQNE